MSGIIRVKKDANYFTASNEPFNDPELSWGARGVMGYLLSKPDGWIVRTEDLVNKGPGGEAQVKRILKELKDHGYMRRYRVNNEKGYLEWATDVYESKHLNPEHKNEPMGENQPVGEPMGEKPTVGKTDGRKIAPIVSTKEEVNTKYNNGRGEKLPEGKKDTPGWQVMNVFIDYSNIPYPDNKPDQGYWWGRANVIIRLADGDTEKSKKLIRKAIDRLREKGLTISSPGSLVNTIRAIIAEDKPQRIIYK